MNAVLGPRLCATARASIAHGDRDGRPAPAPASDMPELAAHRACFVTLHLQGRLRGCIGSLEPTRPLLADVHENAWAAAYRDPRFAPVAREDVARLSLHLSVLTPMEPLAFRDEDELLSLLRPDVDGLVIRDGSRRGTFLPAVWEKLPEPADFLAALKQKAGLARTASGFEAFRYRCESWSCEGG